MPIAGLSLTLSNALTGLNVNQQALAVLSQNIANANTAGYSRQIVNQQSVYLDGQGEGVSIASITRKIDAYLARAVNNQNSLSGAADIINDYHTRIQLLMGSPGSANSLDAYTTNFFNALQALTLTPQDTTLQQTAVNSGVTLASQIQQLAVALRDLQFETDRDLNAAITIVNSDLRNLRQLNTTIANNAALGKSVADLQDQRDILLNDIAKYIGISTFAKEDGSINITTGNGVSLLDDNLYELSYNPAGSAAAFSNGTQLSPLIVNRLDSSGNVVGEGVQLVSGGTPANVVSTLSSGKLAGLIDMRDETLPNIMSQLDMLAAALRDQVNALHNAGSGFPGAHSLTGTRAVNAGDYNQWSGELRIAVLRPNGQPILSPYADELNGLQPLTLDLSTLDTGNGAGSPSIQGIIDAINDYFGTPQDKVELGNLNNIELVSNSSTLPNAGSQLVFDFDLNNISRLSSNFYVTGMQILDSTAADITSVTSTIPSVALASTNTYVTTNASTTVTVNTAAAHGLSNGDRVYLSTPGGAVNGIPAGDLGGFFIITNVTTSSFDITVATPATGAAQADVAGQTAMPPYQGVAAGDSTRSTANGIFTADLSANTSSAYYDIIVDVAVDDGNGNLSTSQITYRINNQQTGIKNRHFGARAADNDGTIVQPYSTDVLARATLVDANGNELPKTAGQYTTLQNGFLKIEAGGATHVISIDSLDSLELGRSSDIPPTPASNRGFSHYFDLNDFFQSNNPIAGGDTTANSALNMQVERRLRNNPSLISTGVLVQGSQPTDSGLPANYTYERNPGDNSLIQRLSTLSSTALSFTAAGGLGASVQTFGGYIGQIIGSAATNADTASTDQKNAQILLSGYTKQVSSISGVNLDKELANTVIYQNAYAASARVISITSDLFKTLLDAF